MSGFTKTVIVDSSLQPPFPPMSYNTIKAAVDAITTAGGGTVYVEQGLYEISDANTDTVTLPSNISVIGSAGAIVKVTKDVVAFQANNEERIYISGLKFVVDCKNNQDQYVEYAQHLIYFRGVKNSVVEKLYFECTSPKGISSNAAAICFNGAAATCENNVIRYCSFIKYGDEYDLSGKMQYKYGYGVLLTTHCHHNTIKLNYFDYCGFSIYLIAECYDNKITNNVFNHSWAEGNDDFDARGCGILIGHYEDRTLVPPVFFNGCDRTSIIGNSISESATHGIYAGDSQNCIVTGNISDGNRSRGIQLNGGDGPIKAQYNSVFGNVCRNNQDGILSGFYSQHNSIMGNSCCLNGRYGILEDCHEYFDAKHPGNALENTFVGNMCQGNSASSPLPVGQIALGHDYHSTPRILLDTDPIAADNEGTICEKTL